MLPNVEFCIPRIAYFVFEVQNFAIEFGNEIDRMPTLPEQDRLDETSEKGANPLPSTIEVKVEEASFNFLDVATKRSYTESEVSQAISIRFLVEKLNEMKKELDALRPFQQRYYEVDRDLQIEKSKVKLTKAQEIVSSVLTTIGGAGMGLSIKFFDKDPIVSISAFVLSAGLVATGIYLKVNSK